jgi:hypothetical protein
MARARSVSRPPNPSTTFAGQAARVFAWSFAGCRESWETSVLAASSLLFFLPPLLSDILSHSSSPPSSQLPRPQPNQGYPACSPDRHRTWEKTGTGLEKEVELPETNQWPPCSDSPVPHRNVKSFVRPRSILIGDLAPTLDAGPQPCRSSTCNRRFPRPLRTFAAVSLQHAMPGHVIIQACSVTVVLACGSFVKDE